MILVSEKEHTSVITKTYRVELIKSSADIVIWVNAIRECDNIKVNFIEFSDLNRRSDEGSNSIQFNADVSAEDLRDAFRHYDVDMISVSGHYRGANIVIAVDLRSKLVSITTRKSNPVNYDSLTSDLASAESRM